MIKKIFKKVIIFALAVFFIFPGNGRANWLDDWYDDVMTSSSGINYFEGQKRGYATFGSFSMRLPTRTDYLFSIEKPHLKIGCGGIDLFMGGFSFLNPDYLVQKVQAMLQVAPFIAFDMALSTLCPTCSEILKKVEALIDALNQIQISECGIYIPKTVVDFAKDPKGFFSSQAEKNTAVAQKKGFSDLFYGFFKRFVHITGDGATMEGVNSNEALAGLPVKLQDWLNNNANTKTGFVQYLANQGDINSQIAEIFRAYVGDLYATSNTNDEKKNLFNVEFRPLCKEAEIKDAFDQGTIYRVDSSGNCVKEDAQKLFKDIENKISKAYDQVYSKEGLSNEFKTLAQNSPVPIYLFLKYAVMTKNKGFMDQTAPDIARGMIYAALLDLSKKIKSVVLAIDAASKGGPANPAGKEILNVIIKNKDEMEEKVDIFQRKITELYRTSMAEMSKIINQAVAYLQFMNLVQKTLNIQTIGM